MATNRGPNRVRLRAIADVSKFKVDSSGSGSKVSQTICSDFFGGGCPEGFYFATIEKLDSNGVLMEEGDDSLIVDSISRDDSWGRR